MFKLFRICSRCGRWYEQNLDNYMCHQPPPFPSYVHINTTALEDNWQCSDCILEEGRQARASQPSISGLLNKILNKIRD